VAKRGSESGASLLQVPKALNVTVSPKQVTDADAGQAKSPAIARIRILERGWANTIARDGVAVGEPVSEYESTPLAPPDLIVGEGRGVWTARSRRNRTSSTASLTRPDTSSSASPARLHLGFGPTVPSPSQRFPLGLLGAFVYAILVLWISLG
jgi:hypothetical protein